MSFATIIFIERDINGSWVDKREFKINYNRSILKKRTKDMEKEF